MSNENKSAKAARQAAQSARKAAEADLRARDRKIRIIGGAVVVAVMAALLAIPLLQGKANGPATDTNAALPAGVSSDTYGVKYGSAWTASNADQIPTLEIWEDFQCPACASTEGLVGSVITDLADQGKIRLMWRPTVFLDENLKAQNTANGNPNSSALATIAFGCAVDLGKAKEFHAAAFAMQPQNEGQGFSVTDLVNIATSGGVIGADTTAFSQCVSSKKYEGWVNNSYDQFTKNGISSTPTAILNGTELTNAVLRDATALTNAINEAAATK